MMDDEREVMGVSVYNGKLYGALYAVTTAETLYVAQRVKAVEQAPNLGAVSNGATPTGLLSVNETPSFKYRDCRALGGA